MLIISHRGNTSGPNEILENNPNHIKGLLQSNIEVEIDVWFIDNVLFLGHDKPQYVVNENFLKSKGLWCHAKNLDALDYMLKNNIKNYFWHQEDNFTLTSSGYIWTFHNKPVTNKSIIVDFKQNWKDENYNSYGVCVDYL
jgi:hypothetical protein